MSYLFVGSSFLLHFENYFFMKNGVFLLNFSVSVSLAHTPPKFLGINTNIFIQK